MPSRQVIPSLESLLKHQQQLAQCTRCPDMIPPVIIGEPAMSSIMSVGQAPGIHEGKVMRPFGWTAGKTLFQWFESIGVEEEDYREKVYMAAVGRCFPGKNPKGSGDRVPNKEEIKNCSHWLQQEYRIIQPKLIIPIGKLAMEQYLDFKRLTEVVGVIHRQKLEGQTVDIIPLPHPSGLSTWYRTDPGKFLLQEALSLIKDHSAWKKAFD